VPRHDRSSTVCLLTLKSTSDLFQLSVAISPVFACILFFLFSWGGWGVFLILFRDPLNRSPFVPFFISHLKCMANVVFRLFRQGNSLSI